MIDSKLHLDSVFVDVRKAYRLLYGYHRRIIDTARLMQQVIAPTSERLGNPPSLTPMSSGRNLLSSDDWVWDATPLISVSFLWVHHSKHKSWRVHHRPGEYMLDIHFIADSAFEEAPDDEEPDPAKFLSPAECRTEIRITVITPREEVAKHDWYTVWDENEYPNHGELRMTWSDHYAVYSEVLPMATFTDKNAIEIVSRKFKRNAFEALYLSE